MCVILEAHLAKSCFYLPCLWLQVWKDDIGCLFYLNVCRYCIQPSASVLTVTLTCCSAWATDLCCETKIAVGTAQCQWALTDPRLDLPLVWSVLDWSWPCSLLKGDAFVIRPKGILFRALCIPLRWINGRLHGRTI